MCKVTFVQSDGTEHQVEAQAGQNLMDCAVEHGITGLPGDCGGAMACATCHGVIASPWFEKLDDKDEMEAEMLEYAEGVEANSRLCCQVIASQELDGMVVRIPQSQY